MYRLLIYIGFSTFLSLSAPAQSLLDELNSENKTNPDTVFAEATFKAPRLVNGQSVETVGKNGLNFTISHRFGNLNTGVKDLYGLDESHIRFGLEYGITSRIDVGLGRSREQKLVDGFVKIKLLRQASGSYNMPVSVSLYSSTAVRTDDGPVAGRNYSLANRLNYVHELLVARKFSELCSFQIVPGMLHRNLTDTKVNPNIVPYIGVGGRIKISSRVSFNTEYYYVLASEVASRFVNPLSFGFDLETGGHIFQLHFSNSRSMHEKLMIGENNNDWLHGDIGFGFNIIRNFNFHKKKLF